MADGARRASGFAGWGLVAILTVANIVSFVDRQIIALLVEPIKADLGLTDTQIGLLQGFSFALFYSLLGLPLARFADRHSRRRLIMVGIMLWSFATAASGLARSFVQLLAARVCVAAGEATLSPAAYSMVTDAFPPQRRSGPMGVYSAGVAAGMGLSLILGGAVIQALDGVSIPGFRSWQLVFLCISALGLLPLLLLAFAREPARPAARDIGAPVQVGLVALFRLRGAFYVPLFVAYGLLSFVVYCATAWGPAYLIRVHGFAAQEAGLSMGTFVVVGGLLGSIGGGFVADRLEALRGVRTKTLMFVLACGLVALPSVGGPLLGSAPAALVGFGLTFLFGTMAIGPVVTLIQEVTPVHQRAQVSAVFLFTTNLIGLGGGPFAVGFLTDHVFHSTQAVGWSIAVASGLASLLALIGAVIAHRAHGRVVRS